MSYEADHVNDLRGHTIIAGFGIVGRYVAETLAAAKLPFCIIELNPTTCERVSHGPVPIIEGDVADPEILRQAGIDRAAVVALAMPDEKKVLAVLQLVRSIRPDVQIIARCTFTSAGFQATKLGADVAIVAEQVVAREFASAVDKAVKPAGAT